MVMTRSRGCELQIDSLFVRCSVSATRGNLQRLQTYLGHLGDWKLSRDVYCDGVNADKMSKCLCGRMVKSWRAKPNLGARGNIPS